MSRIAVVILNFNGEKLFSTFLPSVIKHSGNAEIVVADNGSTDRSVSILEEQFPTVKILRLEKNYGFCGGYNRALKLIDAEYFVLLNSDVEVTEGWLEPLARTLDRDPLVAAVQPKILSHGKPTQFEYAGAGGGFIDSFGYPFCRGRIFDFVESDQHQYDDERPAFWASGACMMIRSEVYHHFNGLDEDFFAHMEEIDLCWKIQRTGSRVFYTGQSVVYHLGAGTLGYNNPRKTYLNFRNGLFMITKHFDTAELVWKLPVRFGLDWVAAGMFLLRGQFAHVKAVLTAHYHYFLDIRIILNKRNLLRKTLPDYDRSSIYRGLALVQYFVFKRKRLIE